MSKTISVRVDDDVYKMIKTAANGEKRTISNFVECAAISYLTDESFVSNDEMQEILKDQDLQKNIRKGLRDIKAGRYKIVK